MMYSIPRGYRSCKVNGGKWWFVATYTDGALGHLDKLQLIVDNGGDDWYRSTAVASVQFDGEATEQYGYPVLTARTLSGSVYHLPVSSLGRSEQLELIRSHSAPKSVILNEYAMKAQLNKLLGFAEDFDVTLLGRKEPLNVDELLVLARQIRDELEKINGLYREMFRKAGYDLDETKRIDPQNGVGEFRTAYPGV